MTSDDRLPAAVLGCTGAVGQRLVSLLARHPWMRPAELLASEQSAGEVYGEAVDWILGRPVPPGAAGREVRAVGAPVEADVVFSALPSGVAGPAEERYAEAGKLVVTNARDHRMEPDVPLLVPEVNPGHLGLVEGQGFADGGAVVANPNCSTAGLVLALAPLHDAFGVDAVQVVTMQALSGAGMPGEAALAMQDNVIPHIGGEEAKLGREPHKILGLLEEKAEGGARVDAAPIRVSAQCTRVPVSDGHLQAVSVRLADAGRPADADALREAWDGYRGPPEVRGLPSAPERPVRYLEGEAHPQPRLHRDAGGGMTATVGRLRACPVLDVRFVTLSHNTIRGAAGGALLSAELALEDDRVRAGR